MGHERGGCLFALSGQCQLFEPEVLGHGVADGVAGRRPAARQLAGGPQPLERVHEDVVAARVEQRSVELVVGGAPCILTVELQTGAAAGKAPDVTVDLLTQTINGTDGRSFPFDVDPRTRELFLNGLDEIGLTLQRGAQIAASRSTDAQQPPWAYNFPTNPTAAEPTPACELPTVGPAGGEVDVDVDPGA